MNLRDRDNLRAKDKRPVPKVSFVRRLDCNNIIILKSVRDLIQWSLRQTLRLLVASSLRSGYYSLGPSGKHVDMRNPNVTKLSKFKLKGVKAQILHMEGCKLSSKLQTQGCKSTELHLEGRKRSNLQTQKLWMAHLAIIIKYKVKKYSINWSLNL